VLRLSALSLLFGNDLEEGDGDEASGRWNERIASLVPLGVVLAAQDMEEVAFVKCQLLTILVLGLVVVESLDDFLGGDDGKGAFGGEGMMGRRLLLLVTLEGSTNSLRYDVSRVRRGGRGDLGGWTL
jgi:hypothetical protein